MQLIFEFCRFAFLSSGKFAVSRWGPVRLWSRLNYYSFSAEQKAETCYDGVALFEIKRAENKLSSVYHSFYFFIPLFPPSHLQYMAEYDYSSNFSLRGTAAERPQMWKYELILQLAIHGRNLFPIYRTIFTIISSPERKKIFSLKIEDTK